MVLAVEVTVGTGNDGNPDERNAQACIHGMVSEEARGDNGGIPDGPNALACTHDMVLAEDARDGNACSPNDASVQAYIRGMAWVVKVEDSGNDCIPDDANVPVYTRGMALVVGEVRGDDSVCILGDANVRVYTRGMVSAMEIGDNACSRDDFRAPVCIHGMASMKEEAREDGSGCTLDDPNAQVYIRGTALARHDDDSASSLDDPSAQVYIPHKA